MSSDSVFAKQMITVSVIAYNSSKTIVETLNSILSQSYGAKNIELVISDDASTDSTVQVVDQWLNVNYNFLGRVVFLKNSVNGGVPKNCNVAWKAASCEWIKPIAADDILTESCLSDYANYVKRNKSIEVVLAKMQTFGVDHENRIIPDNKGFKVFHLDAADQYLHILKYSLGGVPTLFIRKHALEKVGYCDEQYRLLEDLPLWLRLTKSDIKLYFMDSVTVNYRVSDSLSLGVQRLINISYLTCLESFYNEKIWPELKGIDKIFISDMKVYFFSLRFTAKLFDNQRTKLSVFFKNFFMIFMFSSYRKFFSRFFD